eukprot:scaffold245857_cov18-Tisochrysis_lutea.AAC.1
MLRAKLQLSPHCPVGVSRTCGDTGHTLNLLKWLGLDLKQAAEHEQINVRLTRRVIERQACLLLKS